MRNLVLLLSLLLSLSSVSPCFGSQDVVMDALVDEMARSMNKLHSNTYPLPYFISYNLKEIEESRYTSSLGAEPEELTSHYRVLYPVVRAGTYDLDSSYPATSRALATTPMPVTDDYAAMRRSLWRATDSAYKNAVTALQWKQSYLSAHDIPDRLSDMTKEQPVVSLTPATHLSIDENKWQAVAQQLSAVFKDYPTLEKSKVVFVARRVNRWYVNSEGSRVRDSYPLFGFIFWASAQAPDGMPVADQDCVAAIDEARIPSTEALTKVAEELAKRVVQLQSAPKADEYCGPVLFEDQGAAEYFAQVMAPNFGFAEEYVGSPEDWRNPLIHRLGKRVFPTDATIVDDPHLKEYKGEPVVGGYDFDDEGIAAQKLMVVENGLFRNFCQSRIPTRQSSHSNGHALGPHGVWNVLQFKSANPASPEALKQKAFELAKEEGLDYVLVIKRMSEVYYLYEFPGGPAGSSDASDRSDSGGGPVRPYATPTYSCQPTDPVVAYRLYLSDGHEELVRGLEFKYVSLRSFRDIQAIGNDERPYVIEPPDDATRSVIVPTYLVGELELTPEKAEFTAAPHLPSPLAKQ